jgi:hypothetical protein
VKTALIVCGALAREVLALKEKHGWEVDVLGVPALLHNEPERLPAAILKRIRQARQDYQRVFVVYGDCGTGGMLDRLLEKEGVQRVTGPHCYEMYADGTFESLMAEAPGTFFLTDYLVQSPIISFWKVSVGSPPQVRDQCKLCRVIHSLGAMNRPLRRAPGEQPNSNASRVQQGATANWRPA